MPNSSNLTQSLKLITLALVIGLGINYVSAVGTWTAPGLTPPNGNVETPLNVNNVGQIKAGGMTLNTGGATNGLIVALGKVGIGIDTPTQALDVNGNVKATQFCLGGSCISVWPSGSSGGGTPQIGGGCSRGDGASGPVNCYAGYTWGNSLSNGCPSGYTKQIISSYVANYDWGGWLCLSNTSGGGGSVTQGYTYATSCGTGATGVVNPFCCRLNTDNTVSCMKSSSSDMVGTWSSTTSPAFPTISGVAYSLMCTNINICCLTNVSTGSAVCKYNRVNGATGIDFWTPMNSPFP